MGNGLLQPVEQRARSKSSDPVLIKSSHKQESNELQSGSRQKQNLNQGKAFKQQNIRSDENVRLLNTYMRNRRFPLDSKSRDELDTPSTKPHPVCDSLSPNHSFANLSDKVSSIKRIKGALLTTQHFSEQ